MTELPKSSTWLLRLEPITRDSAAGLIDLRVVLGGNISSLNGFVNLTFSFNGQSPASPIRVSVDENGDAFLSSLTVPNAKPWNIGEVFYCYLPIFIIFVKIFVIIITYLSLKFLSDVICCALNRAICTL